MEFPRGKSGLWLFLLFLDDPLSLNAPAHSLTLPNSRTLSTTLTYGVKSTNITIFIIGLVYRKKSHPTVITIMQKISVQRFLELNHLE